MQDGPGPPCKGSPSPVGGVRGAECIYPVIFGMVKINRHTVLGFLAILLWSTSIALARSIAEEVGPLTAGAAVYLTGGSILAGNLLCRDHAVARLLQLPRLYLFGCGALFLIYTTALYLGLGLALDRRQAIEIGLVNYLWPTLTIVFSLIILSKRATVLLIPGTVSALCGIVLVLTQQTELSWVSFFTNLSSNPAAYGLGLVAALTWGLYSTLTRLWGSDDGGGVPLFIPVTGVALLLLCLSRGEGGSWSLPVVVEVGVLGLSTALAYLFWDNAMRRGDMILVASGSYFTPLLSTVVSCIYLQVMPGISLWIGCLLIVGGSFLSWYAIEE